LIENNYPGIDERAVRAVTLKSKKLIEQCGYSQDELPDLQQDWLIRILQSKEYQNRKDPQFAHHINRMVASCYVDEVRKRNTLKRRCDAKSISLEGYFCVDSREAEALNISEDIYFAFTGTAPIGPNKSAQNKLDAEEFLQSLPQELCHLAKLLMQLPITEAISETGVPRATAFRRLKQLREHAESFFKEK
jgi:RNA polymerase sigma-70 factor (ECF subfamily)